MCSSRLDLTHSTPVDPGCAARKRAGKWLTKQKIPEPAHHLISGVLRLTMDSLDDTGNLFGSPSSKRVRTTPGITRTLPMVTCRFHRMISATVCLVLAIAATFPAIAASQPAPASRAVRMTISTFRPLNYDAVVSEEDDTFRNSQSRLANLMQPPQYNLDLCLDPARSLDPAPPVQGTYEPQTTPIALFVPLTDKCSPATQVKHASRLELASFIRYLVFASTDMANLDQVPEPALIELEDATAPLSFLYVSTWTGLSLANIMENPAVNSASPMPYLGQQNNDAWNLPVSIRSRQDRATPQGNNSAVILYGVFLVIFVFLFMTPCCLLAYRSGRWWCGHPVVDTIGLHVNTTGAVVTPDDKHLLTKKQIMALPELVYSSAPDDVEAATYSTKTTTTTSTMCSICIQDFEEGERIRVLPACHHAHHTDCILPWLTERVGTCPDCKTAVLDDEEKSDHVNANNPEGNERAAEETAPPV